MFLTRDQVRAVDRRAIEEFGVPGLILMENAGRGSAELLLRLGAHGPIMICCGKGNNGGDGFVIARHLDNASIPIKVLLFAKPADLTGDAAVNYHILDKAGLPVTILTHGASAKKGPDPMKSKGSDPFLARLEQELAGADWIVDALFGTGLSGAVKPPFDVIIDTINQTGARVLAVDIPSGLDCDTGQPLGVAIRAQHTATFVAQKVGFSQAAAQAWLGQVHVLPIGAPREQQLARQIAG
jgi:NAD(P)H-hydrate epimerase